MNNLLLAIIIILSLSCKSQHQDNTSSYILSNDFFKKENSSFLERYISKYVDSLNNIMDETEIPVFLSDSQFDYKNKGIWHSFHTPISVRSQIINRVNSCKALTLIVNSENAAIKRKPYIEDSLTVPFIEFSFYDLALKRLNILECH